MKKVNFCGLDFGTSNSTIGIYSQNECKLVPLDGAKPTLRSAIFCNTEDKKFVFGQDGVEQYLNGVSGRLIMALKSVLGSSLMFEKTFVFNKLAPYTDILSNFISFIKEKAEIQLNAELKQVVLGRPVRFHDTDNERDKIAQETLEEIARAAGFEEVRFQYEPIAAAITYEQSIQNEQLALIVDMGGGTSDFTVIKLSHLQNKSERTDDVLSNKGIHIGGTDFDRELSLRLVMPLLGMSSMISGTSCDITMPSSYYHELTTWHTLNDLYSNQTIARVQNILAVAHEKELVNRLITVLKRRQGHHILYSVEMTKLKLSELVDYLLDLSFICDDLSILATQNKFNETIDIYLEQLANKINETIKESNIKHSDIHAIFYTGGSTKIPIIRNRINSMFPSATIVQGDAFNSVGLGLTYDAKNNFMR